MHHDPVVPILFSLSLIIIASKLGAALADKMKQPPVLGELVAGIVIGNLTLLNFHFFDQLAHDHTVEIFASLGVIILLFEVGLESNLEEMLAVGVQSFIVAIVGVVTPFAVGYFASGLLLPDLAEISKIFMGAILTATSVGITARVFKDLDFTKAFESKIVLGAAVIDDILGLIILAVVSGIAQTGEIEIISISLITAKAVAFVVLAVVLGLFLSKRTFHLLKQFNIDGMYLSGALLFCFIGAFLANQVGLATIVGAFAMGLVLDEVHLEIDHHDEKLEDMVRPISLFLVPIFFVITGMSVDLSVFGDFTVLGAALILTLVAILGKLICGWCFKSERPVNRMIIGMGMVPRGEVGLIFATVGKSIGVVDDRLYAITIIMVILTTLIPPPILSNLINKQKAQLDKVL